MKQPKTIIFILAFVFSIQTLYADDLSVGISGWYADWEIKFKFFDTTEITQTDPVLCIGPSLSYQFAPDWSATLIALFTPKEFKLGSDDDDKLSNVRRYDSDIALNFKLHEYIKLFAGGKYLGYTFKNGKNYSFGPGAGVGFIVPIISKVYILGSGSLLYLYGKEESNDVSSAYRYDIKGNGYNITGQIAYYFTSLELTAAAGYRYQYIRYTYTDTDSTDDNDFKMNFIFKGITFLVVKSFNWE